MMNMSWDDNTKKSNDDIKKWVVRKQVFYSGAQNEQEKEKGGNVKNGWCKKRHLKTGQKSKEKLKGKDEEKGNVKNGWCEKR